MANKDTIIDEVALKTGYTKKDIKVVLDSVFDTIMNLVRSGEPVNIFGFGKFDKTERAARTGVNPRTREPMQIDAVVVPKFYAGSVFKQLVKAEV